MMSENWKVIAGVVAGLFVLVMIFRMRRRPRPVSAEDSPVKSILENLGREYSVLHDIYLTLEKGIARIGHLVVSPYGIFLVNERPEQGKIAGRSNLREWDVTGFGQNETIYNPLWRNRSAINALQSRLSRQVVIISLVVFPFAKIKSKFGPEVVSARGLTKSIRRHTRRIFSEEALKALLAELEGLKTKR